MSDSQSERPAHRMRQVGRVLQLAGREFFKDNGPSWAAAIAYYSLLSLFPLLLAAGSVGASFLEPQLVVQQATGYLSELLPRGSGAIDKIVQQTFEEDRRTGLLFIFPLLWTGSLVFNAISKALNTAFDAEDSSSFGRRILDRLLMLLTLGAMFLGALASTFALGMLRTTLGYLPAGQELLYQLIRAVLPPAFMLLAFFLAYRFVPARRVLWRSALLGAVVASLLFAAAKPLFLNYVRNLSSYSDVYGPLTGVIIIVLWTWIVAMIGLFGGQICRHSHPLFAEPRKRCS